MVTMTKEQKIKIIQKIVDLENDIEALKKTRLEIGVNGYSSASLSSTGGSRSYTRLDLDKIQELINCLQNELSQQRSLLSSGSSTCLKVIDTIYC